MEVVWKVGRGGHAPVTSGDALKALLLRQRGVAKDQTSTFFEPRYERDVHDPFLLRDMSRATERLYQASASGERVLVYGDYDADGICSTAILTATLQELGVAVLPYLPHRLEDGYGLNSGALKRLASEFDLLVTVDCGISNTREIAWLAAQGKDTIIADHHTLPNQLPEAIAILHPALGDYPFLHLSGAGVTWKLAQALLRDERFGLSEDQDREKWLLDLCCLGTVADMVPLTDENRAIVWFGFEVLRRSKRPGVRLLLSAARQGGQEIDSELISFRIAPLLNAAGRMDHAQPALDLLLTSRQDHAEKLLRELRRHNEARRRVSRQVQLEAEEEIALDAPVVFAYSERWPAGVVGLVAGRLSEKFARPSVVVGNGGNHAVGSVRAPAGFNAMDLMTTARQHMLKLGGHEGAAGFSVARDNVVALRNVLLNAPGPSGGELLVREERADALIDLSLLTWDTMEVLDQFQPHGEGNRRPVLIGREATLLDWRPVGKAQDHAKFTFRIGDEVMDGIGFGLARDAKLEAIEGKEEVDVLFHLDRNEYRGKRSLQLLVQDIALTGTVRIEGA